MNQRILRLRLRMTTLRALPFPVEAAPGRAILAAGVGARAGALQVLVYRVQRDDIIDSARIQSNETNSVCWHVVNGWNCNSGYS